MTPEERDLINGLFERLQKVDNAQKDREAEQLIQSKVSQQPSAPYLLAQTVLVQEHALNNAQARIAQLERQAVEAARGGDQGQNQGGGSGAGGFLSGLFGGGGNRGSGSNPPQSGASYQQAPPPMPAPNYPSTMNMAPSAGGGFLRTALAAAAGVAGGSLLMHGFQNLLGQNAGPFASSLGGMGGMGSGFLGGMGGGSEIVENREVINNYYGDNAGQNAGGDGIFGGGSGFGFGEGSSGPDQPGTVGSSFLGGGEGSGGLQDTGYDTPPTDDASTDDSGGYDTPPTDDPSDFDNSGSDLADSGGDSGGSDDSGWA